VLENEKSAFLEALENNNTIYSFADTLTDAIEKALAAAGSGDLLLLLGAQGMDNGYRVLRHLLAARPEAAASQRCAAAEALV
jgi:UDP-N-acetylmuramoyl-L-alanyl-D-glutamate--2,6-diaminopimelate ligase